MRRTCSRRQGYATADEEHEAGIRAVAVPVLSAAGLATAALSTAAPAFRMPLDRLVEFVGPLADAARELAVQLPARSVLVS